MEAEVHLVVDIALPTHVSRSSVGLALIGLCWIGWIDTIDKRRTQSLLKSFVCCCFVVVVE
eukprot:7433184-Ditylum_brightwellii.AAC.1